MPSTPKMQPFWYFLKPPCPSGEQITNGGFELGSLIGWDHSGNVSVTSDEKHSGAYSAHFYEYPSGANIWQNIITPTPKHCITSWTFWFKVMHAYPMWGSFLVIITYTDDTTTEAWFQEFDQLWHEGDLLSLVEDGKTVKKVEFQYWCGSLFHAYLDDISLIGSG